MTIALVRRMRIAVRGLSVPFVALLLACGAVEHAGGLGQSANDAAASGPDGAIDQWASDEVAVEAQTDSSHSSGCAVTGASSLPGVSIAFRMPVTCTFTAAQALAGIAIPYDVVVTNDVAGVILTPRDAGGCGVPGNSGLIVFEQLAGNAQSYCLCDTGLCGPSSLPPVTLHPGSYAGAFSWDGKNWNGPSDTGNPKGAPFPPGTYTLSVRATGTSGGSIFVVSATLAIRLTP
jgi:hypothetical protein